MSTLDARLGVCSWSLHPKNPADLIGEMKQLGLTKLQIALDMVRTDPAWADTKTQLAQAGIALVSGMFGCVGEDYSTLDSIRQTGGIVPDQHWEQTWSNIQANLPVAQALGIKLVTFHGGFLPPDANHPVYEKLFVRMHQIADLYAGAGIQLALETGQEDARTLRLFLERLGRKDLGVNFDPANMILYAKGEPVESVKILGPYLKQIHVKDATPTKVPGTWGVEVAVGTGQVNWKGFFQALREMNFPGHFIIEREAGDQRIPDIQQAIKLLRASWA